MNEKFITVVSGLPRSGTSLMMQMLAAGGLPLLTDAVRLPDESNPHGYLEFERVKHLRNDKSWLEDACGKAVKIIHLLLRELPTDGRFDYRVLFLKRPLEEVMASQQAMLASQGKEGADVGALTTIFQAQLVQLENWLALQTCFRVKTVEYHGVLKDPSAVAEEIKFFLGLEMDLSAMATVVDGALYRQRRIPGS